ncbi:DUF221-domain-containing protein [Artomyces pyxidatus]|uniref:DUF221-domain-containing protein n=1 Tax=Artomyces pyxidatus TaxID=48021 RepID=A0ACB8T737_9AGAM|nr:DUF221-domain-containing protein [Artomyces pyxidatus]
MSNLNGATTASTGTFETALVLNAAIFGIEVAAFTILRRYFRLIYEPRSLSVVESKRQPPLSSKLLGWPISVYNADYRKIKNINGMDAYFYVRFLRMMVRVMLPIWLLSWAVLLPITSVNTTVAGHTGLDKFIFGNVSPDKQSRYAAHVLLTWIFTIWIWWNIKHEMAHFIRVRQHYLISPSHSSSAQASTILVTGIPTKYLSESALTRLFSHLPGGVRRVWLNRDLGDMPDLYKRRLTAEKKLESAETAYLKIALKKHNKNLKKEAKANGSDNHDGSTTVLTAPSADPEARRTLAQELVPQKKRPSHRLPLMSWMPALPLVGKKVDSIEWAREEIRVTNEALAEKRAVLAKDIERTTLKDGQGTDRVHRLKAGRFDIAVPSVPVSIPGMGAHPDADFSDQTYPPANGAFVLFNRQIAAHLAVQSLTHHDPYRMGEASKYVEIAPEDIIWDNLGMNPYERRVRLALSWAATIGLIIVWAIPVAFVGAVSNIHSLCTTYHWLNWVCTLPHVVVNFIQGFLPTVLLAVLFMLLPIVLRMLARFEGIPQRTGVELSLMDRFFLFEVINGFLVVTLSSGIIASLPGLLNNPTSVPTLLAQNLPKSSTFFLTYIILQGLSGTAGGLLQIVSLILYYVKLVLMGATPRSVYNIKYKARTSNWGTLFPQTTLLVVITLGYSIISPIINGLAWFTFFLFYMMYKYTFTWVNDQPPTGDTGGLFFPKAIQQVFVGLYIQQICLCALFFLAQNENHKPGAIPEGALMVVLIIFTAFFQNTMINSYGPLKKFLPLSLAERSYDMEREERAAAETANAGRIPAEPEPATAEGVDHAIKKEHVQHLDDTKVDDAKGSPEIGVEHARRASGSFSEAHGGSRSPSPAPTRPAEKEHVSDFSFSHPAAVEPQRAIWLPRDPLGLIDETERALRAEGIEYSTEGAELDAKGGVSVTSAPPDIAEAQKTRPPLIEGQSDAPLDEGWRASKQV